MTVLAVFKHKMCGGNPKLTNMSTVFECISCGAKQPPIYDDEKKITLYNRANSLRLNNKFDKAYNLYETVIAQDVYDAMPDLDYLVFLPK